VPSYALHFQLAQGVLERWPEPGSLVIGEPAVHNAFLTGSLGPDMGYYPGGDGFLSDLAHYVSSAELTRNLLRLAATEVERAYAWGWVTHLLADIAVHPLVNRGAGELVHGDRGRPLTFVEDTSAHVRVEVGLDAVFYDSRPGARGVRLKPAFDDASVSFLERAFAATYGVPFPAESLLASHRAVVRYVPFLARLNRVMGRRHRGRLPRPLDLPLYLLGVLPARWATGWLAAGSQPYNFTHTVAPGPWLVEAVDQVARRFPRLFARHHRDSLATLADHNLDTGQVEPDPSTYPLTRATLEELDRRSRIPRGNGIRLNSQSTE